MGGDAARRRGDVASALGAAGYEPGRDLMVHSAYSSIKDAVSGPEEIVDALAAAVGPTGRLLFPALSYDVVTGRNPVFDAAFTRSCVGYLAEEFRTRFAEARSMHPTHSAAGLGPGVGELLGRHLLDSTPVGPHSPFTSLRDSGGFILMLGCGLDTCTSMHGVEELFEPDYLFGPELDYRLVAADGSTFVKRYRPHDFRGTRQRYDRLEKVMTGSELRRFRLLGADCWLIHAPTLWKAAGEVMAHNKRFFVDSEPAARP
jgi:aminoglycoside 3-N-acetyltransferase